MEAPSGFDRIVLPLVAAGMPVAIGDVIRRIQHQNDTSSAHVAAETFFTAGEHPFDGIRIATASIERTTGDGYEALTITDAEGTWSVVASETLHRHVYHLLSGQPRTSKRWAKLDRALASSSHASRCYLNHRDFLSIAGRLERFGKLEVSRATARKSYDRSSIGRGFSEARPTPQGAIEELEEQGGVLRTMTMHSSEIGLQLRRIAGATFYSGRALLFRDEVLAPLADAAAARQKLVSARARLSVVEDVRPLSVRLPENLFNDRDDTATLLDAAARMQGTSLAVFHRNPYLHFAIRDERDGSNFDVIVTEANAIQIYPGYRASQSSLARVSQELGERFGALSIEDAPAREPVSVTSLIG